MPGRNGLVAPPDYGIKPDIMDLDCEQHPCNSRASCIHNDGLYCSNCLAAEFSEELYSIERKFLGGKAPPACTYAVCCDDDDVAVAIEVKFSKLNTFNGSGPSTPFKISLKELEQMKTKETDDGLQTA